MVCREVWGLIPAAGKGERLRPLTDNMPKCMVEVGGKPLLEHAILALKSMGINKVVIVVGYMKERIIEFLNSNNFGVEIVFAYPDKLLGLAYSIYSARDIVSGTIVMMLPDNIYTDECSYALNTHLNEDALVSMIVEPGDPENRYETIRLEGNRITDIVEKADFSYGWRGTAVYIFDHEFYAYFESLDISVRGETELQDVITKALRCGGKIVGVKIRGNRFDITVPEDISKTEFALDSLKNH